MSGSNEKIDVMVDHPAHYKSETGLEAIDVIEAFTFDLKGTEAVCTGNVLKYICRWPHKNGLQDLKKARWYLDRLIKHIEKLKEENEGLKKNTFEIPFIGLSKDDFHKAILNINEEDGHVSIYCAKTIAGIKPLDGDYEYGWRGPFEIKYGEDNKGQICAIFPKPIKL